MGKPQHSIRISVIVPGKINEDLLDAMNIDIGMRTLIVSLLNKGYDTWHSCSGHDGNQTYLTFRRGTGDGSFERTASMYGFKEHPFSECCFRSKEPYCPKCGSSQHFKVYRNQRPMELLFSNVA